jgi:hypothetical protein
MAANAMRGEVAFGDYTLVYTFNAFCLLEQETGVHTQNLLQMMQEGLGFSDLRAFVWAGLQEKYPLKLTDAGDLIGQIGLTEALTAVGKGVDAFLAPAVKEAKDARPLKAA